MQALTIIERAARGSIALAVDTFDAWTALRDSLIVTCPVAPTEPGEPAGWARRPRQAALACLADAQRARPA